MKMESDSELSLENGESFFGPKDMSLDIKLAFARVCQKIDALDESGESMHILRRIQKEAKLLLLRKRNEAKEKFNETQHTISSVSVLRNRQYLAPEFSRTTYSDKIQDLTSLNNTSFFGVNPKLHSLTSEPISFRPVKKKNPHGTVQLGAIPEIREEIHAIDVEEEQSSLESSSYQETLGENSAYVLKNWSVKKIKNNLFLTGVKMDRKGNVIENDFISKKIIARPEAELVRTEEGEFLIQEPISDPNNTIPSEIIEEFEKENFPRYWRKLLTMWNDIDKQQAAKKSKPRKNSLGDKKNVPKVSKKDTSSGSKKKEPKENQNTPKENQKSALKENQKNTPKGNQKNTPKDNKKDISLETDPIKQNKKNTRIDNKKTASKVSQMPKDEKIEKKRAANKVTSKSNVQKSPGRPKKVEQSKSQKKPQVLSNLRISDQSDFFGEDNSEFEEGLDGGIEEYPEFDTESMRNISGPSVTPSALMNTIKETTTKGRFTPPTDVFIDIYGHSQSTNSSITSTPLPCTGVLAQKNKEVVNRILKAKTTFKGKKRRKAGGCQDDDDKFEHDLIGEVLKATIKTNTTPTIVKDVFRNEGDSSEELSEDSNGNSD